MTENFKILVEFIKDMSSETPDVQSYLFVKDNISKYHLDIDVSSKPLKNKLIEVNTTLKFEDKEPNEKKSHFEMTYASIVKIDKKNVVDTLELARNKFPGSSISLDALCKRYRIDNSKRIQHTALIDCELLYKVYINLIDQKEPTLNFQNQENNNLDININNNNLYCKKIIEATPEELHLHKNYFKINLKKNYFN